MAQASYEKCATHAKRAHFAALAAWLAALALTCACAFAFTPAAAFASEAHTIAFASDRHGNETAVGEAMGNMSLNVEYISLIGDMVGSGGGGDKPPAADPSTIGDGGGSNRAPAFDSSTVCGEMLGIGFKNVTSAEDVSILWADHDAGVNDDAGIVFANAGYGSGLMKTGLNTDGSVAYYVYGIGFYEMRNAEDAQSASAQFKSWIDQVPDKTIPIIVCCHMPLHYARGDNAGAVAWSKALNYAATGVEDPAPGMAASRNVVYLFGHNHTVESSKDRQTGDLTASGEFYVPCGASMEVGATPNEWMPIYYTYTTAGYLNQNTTATQITLLNNTIMLVKYQAGRIADALYDTTSKKSGAFASEFKTSGVNLIARVQAVSVDVPDECSVLLTDASGGVLSVNESGDYYLPADQTTLEVVCANDVFTTDSITMMNGQTTLPAQKQAPNKYTFALPKTDGGITIAVKLKERIALDDALVSGIEANYTYTGLAIEPTPVVTLAEKALIPGIDFKVALNNNVNVGTATMTITGTDDYLGSKTCTFQIGKAKNTLKVKGRAVNVKLAKLQKRLQVVEGSKAIKVRDAFGTLKYEKISGNKKIVVDPNTGTLVVKKGLRKGAYRVIAMITAAGDDNHKASAPKFAIVNLKVA